MRKRIQVLPKFQQHLYSLVLSILCMAAAAGISSAYICASPGNSANVPLIFAFFLALISCCTTGYVYGVLCSLFSVLWLYIIDTRHSCHLDLSPAGYPVTILCMTAITLLLGSLTSSLAKQSASLAERERLLAEAEKEKIRANLLRAISHDLRTPLTGIIDNSQAYMDHHADLTEEEKLSLMTNIYEDSSWLVNMVENLLSITRIRNEDMAISTSEESVEEVIGESLQRMQKRHPSCRIRARIPEELIMLPMDAILIEQVTINLLENALSHSGTDEPVELIVENHPEWVSFTIRDHGSGLPHSLLDHLFDGTDYSASHTADGQKGIGIGLVICKTIIDAHQGTLTGRNHGHGAEFTFTLPKKKGTYEN